MPRKPKPVKPKKTCVKCNEYFAVNDEKYCSSCRAEVLKKMKDEGYLASPVIPVAVNRERRDRSQRSTNTVGGTSEMNQDGDDW
jgi:hypothetical protein